MIWSADAAKSEWVLSEANRARENRKLVQLVIDKTRLPMPFDQVQCADLSGWTGEGEHPNWRRVTASIGELVDGKGGAQRAPVSTPTPLAPKPAPAEPLLAVLAFDNLSGDPQMAYFSDGVSEEIRETVARGADLKVIGRASSFHFRGADKAAAHVADQLGATHVLDGSVRRSGRRVRISAELVQCANATTLWSERFDRELTDIFALQDEIAAAVAAAMKRAFAASAPVGRIDPEAYDLYLRTRQAGFGATFDERPRIAALQQVTTSAPRLASAWGLLAFLSARQLRGRHRGPHYEAMRAEVERSAETALRLDPGCGVAYTALAWLEPWANFAEREALLGKALAAAPNEPDIHIAMVELLYTLGRYYEAGSHANHAVEIDPLHVLAAFWNAASLCEYRDERMPEIMHQRFTSFRLRWPQELALGIAEAWIQAFVGRWDLFDDTIAAMRRVAALPSFFEERFARFNAMRDPGPAAQTAVMGRLNDDLARTGTVQIWDLFAAYSVGLEDEMYAVIEMASFAHLFDRDGPPPSGTGQTGAMLAVNPRFRMPTDPRIMRLCAKMGFCDYWVQTGRWPDCADQVPYDFRAEARKVAAEGLARQV